MGGGSVGVLVLADAATSVQRFVSVFVGVYVLLILAYVLTSWIPLPVRRRRWSASGSSSTTSASHTCGLFRRIIPPLGPLDLSPIAAVFSLYILERLVNTLIERLL